VLRRPVEHAPQKRTLVERMGMSAKCQKRTLASLFDHLVGERKHIVRHREVHRFCGFHIDDEQVVRWDLDRQIGWLRFSITIRIRSASEMLNPTWKSLRPNARLSKDNKGQRITQGREWIF
jgi:hypothetical protein